MIGRATHFSRLSCCGQSNAFWNPEKRALIYCCELGQKHLDLWNAAP
jgi:hypothetical protein